MATTTKEISLGDIGSRASQHDDAVKGENMILNMGPSHPATHGVLRLRLELDGDLVTKCDPVIGYLHRGDEKIAENMTYNQFVPYTDRLDYLAPLSNNVAYAIAVEKLAKLKVPPRCEAIRVLVCELARISSHLLGLGVFAMDTGAWTVFMYTFTEREKLYTLFEELTGARFTTSYTRIGGVARDMPEGWLDRVIKFNDGVLKVIDEVDTLLTRNKIFLDRTQGLAPISGALPDATCAPPASRTTSARTTRTPATSSTSSTSPSAPSATATTATSSAWKRCASPCASSVRSSRRCPPAPITPRTPRRFSCRPRTRCSRRWRN
jgi:NADH-quinone oxidoreductase subunit D